MRKKREEQERDARKERNQKEKPETNKNPTNEGETKLEKHRQGKKRYRVGAKTLLLKKNGAGFRRGGGELASSRPERTDGALGV